MTLNVSLDLIAQSETALMGGLQVTTYMRQLSETQDTVESFLKVLGPGNWGGPPNRTPITSDDGEEPTLLTRYLSASTFVVIHDPY